MIKLGIIADTHIPIKSKTLPDEIFTLFEGSNLILHAGDLVDLSVIDELKKIAPVKAVYGNMDKEDVKKKFPRKQIIKIGKFKIGLIHTLGRISDRIQRVKEEFPKSKINVIVFGHSHVPVNEKKNGILFFNPGCPVDDIFCPYRSIGMLTISDKIEGKIIKLKNI